MGGSHKGRLRRAAAECVLLSESLCGEDGGFRKGGEVGGQQSLKHDKPPKAPGT